MSNEFKALGDLKRFAESFSGILWLAEEMAKVGSVKQAGDEANNRLAAIRGKLQLGEETLKKQAEDYAVLQKRVDHLAVIEGQMRDEQDAWRKSFDKEQQTTKQQAEFRAKQIANEIETLGRTVNELAAHKTLLLDAVEKLAAEEGALKKTVAQHLEDIEAMKGKQALVEAQIENLRKKLG